MRYFKIYLALALIFLVGYLFYPYLFPHSYHFRMIVEIETPQGLRSGSSVYKVWAHNTHALLPDEAARDWGVKGEAVAVDLPGGKTLFALLKTVNTAGHDDLAFTSMAALDPKFNFDYVESAARIASGDGLRSPAEVVQDNYPLLVTFRDIADPKSVERVDPENLAASFGKGVQLKRITVAVTDEPVTVGIEKRLGWLLAMEQHDFERDGPFYKSYPTELLGLRNK